MQRIKSSIRNESLQMEKLKTKTAFGKSQVQNLND